MKVYETDEFTIEIDYDKCEGHGECIAVCPAEVYELVDGKATAPNVAECTECCSCVEVCPTEAIEHSSC
ncbi:MAG: indolepyruvate ferredoxin oxidoreductase subunit alpha [Candidatus Hydrothermarchaeaceae archaeon]